MNLQDATPAEIDTKLAEIWARYYAIDAKADVLRADIRRYRKAGGYRELIAELTASVARYEERGAAVLIEAEPYEAEYARRGGWTRYFLVDNKNGHVHNGRGCSTCKVTTRYKWLVELAAKPAEELYAADNLGAMVCSTCYPDAPVAPAPSAVAAPADIKCDGRPTGGLRIQQKCTKCNHLGTARAWRRHKPKR